MFSTNIDETMHSKWLEQKQEACSNWMTERVHADGDQGTWFMQIKLVQYSHVQYYRQCVWNQ